MSAGVVASRTNAFIRHCDSLQEACSTAMPLERSRVAANAAQWVLTELLAQVRLRHT